MYDTGDWNSNHPSEKKEGKWRSFGRIVAMALVFGVVAGLVTYGTYRAANAIHPVVPEAKAASESAEEMEPEESGDTESVKADSSVRSSSGSTDGSASAESAGSQGGTETSAGTGILTVQQVAANSMPSLVTISTMSVQEMQSFFGGTQEYQVQGAGTGVIIGENDTELLIATNNHVVEGAQQLSVGFIDESVVSGNIKGTDENHDLAVVAVKLADISDQTMKSVRSAVIGDSDALELGEQVVAIGNALGYGQSVTSGYVSGLNRSLEFQDGSRTFESDGLIQTDAAINSGNSGGALLNMKGELVGINEAKSSMSTSGATVDNIGYAIPMAKARPILEKLMNEKTREIVSDSERGYLGVTAADVTSEYAEVYNMPEGVCFTYVDKDGPAGKAGARKGDVLTDFDGKAVDNYDGLERILQYYRAGEQVTMTVQRAMNGKYKPQILTITLGTKDALDNVKDHTQQDEQPEQESPFRGSLFDRLFGGY